MGSRVDGRVRGRRRLGRRLAVVAAVLAALVAGATGLAASQGQPRDARALGDFFFGPNMARAEVVMVIRGTVHDFRIDQGRLVAVRPGAVELAERDGTRQTIPVSPTAQVLVNGQPATAADLARGMNVITVRDGDQPAEAVRASAVGGRPGKRPGKP